MSLDDGLTTPSTSDHQPSAETAELRGLRRAAGDALDRLEDAQDALEDADGAVVVAEARSQEFGVDETKAEWERLAAQEDLARAIRDRGRAAAAVKRRDREHHEAEQFLTKAQGAQRAPADEDLHFPTVYAFVDTFLVRVHARYYEPMGTSWNWCSQWWDHTEAVSRLEALWQAFETLRRDPGTGPAVWWRDYCDPTMAQLTAPEGPFSRCKAGERHTVPDPLPSTPAPEGLLEETRVGGER